MYSIALYILAIGLLMISYKKDKKKTKKALKKTWKSFGNLLPKLLSIFVLIGLILSVLNPQTISNILGQQSNWLGVVIASLIGAITLIPGFVAFPLASTLIKNGAGYTQMAVFISTLMMVGIVTIPIEVKYFGKKVTILRNVLAYLFSFLVAFVIGGILG